MAEPGDPFEPPADRTVWRGDVRRGALVVPRLSFFPWPGPCALCGEPDGVRPVPQRVTDLPGWALGTLVFGPLFFVAVAAVASRRTCFTPSLCPAHAQARQLRPVVPLILAAMALYCALALYAAQLPAVVLTALSAVAILPTLGPLHGLPGLRVRVGRGGTRIEGLHADFLAVVQGNLAP